MATDHSHVLVWDWTVRLFHWLTVSLVALMWWTAEQGAMDWHKRLGLALLGLLVYRLAWGLIGTPAARFSHMVFHPRTLAAYLRDLRSGRHGPSFGHNPAGVLSVAAMLLALSVQVGTGLFAVDVDGLESGPLASLVTFESGRQLAGIHEISFNILLGLIVLHLLAIITYLVLFRDNLIRPMITGRRRRSDFGTEVPADNPAQWPRVMIAAALAGACVAAVLFVG